MNAEERKAIAMLDTILKIFVNVGGGLTDFPIDKLQLYHEQDGSNSLQYFDGKRAIKLVPCQSGYDVCFNHKKGKIWEPIEAYCTDIAPEEMTIKNIVTKAVKIVDKLYKQYWKHHA